MCGRFSLFQANDEILIERFGASKMEKAFVKRYNISPSQDIYAILNESPEVISSIKWGLVPFWAKDPEIGNRMINARAESLTEKPAFKSAIRSKRCLIPADGFYEWKKEPKGPKRPFRITLKDEALFAFAGLWDIWEKDNKKIVSCSIITTRANSIIEPIHERMPVILKKEDETKWLSENNLPAVLNLLRPYSSKAMRTAEISTLINSPGNDREEALK